MSGLLERVLASQQSAYALIYRPESGSPGMLDILVGKIMEPVSLADISLDESSVPGAAQELLVVIPYRQLTERGLPARDDGTPLFAITVTEHDQVPMASVLTRIPVTATILADGHFDIDDTAYAGVVRQIMAEEIGAGEGANFVIKRTFTARILNYSPPMAISFFRQLLEREEGAYWTFIIHSGDTTLVGATPERHISLDSGTAVMNPISGTYRYPAMGPSLQGIKEFLADTKETDELYMVLDEELKMMARICEAGGRIRGPYLKEMAWLAHTEYLIEGKTDRDVRTILRDTMFAPTVTGSPLESAARVIHRYEPGGRRYYSGVAALIGRSGNGDRRLDSAILIRTADINPDGQLRIATGATLVRHSDPSAEAAETRAKLAGLLSALEPGRGTPLRAHSPTRTAVNRCSDELPDIGEQQAYTGDLAAPEPAGATAIAREPAGASTRTRSRRRALLGTHPEVQAALNRRNDNLATFWRQHPNTSDPAVTELVEGTTALVIDAEDSFTEMLDKQLRSLGLSVTVTSFDEPHQMSGHGLLVVGPGPGDPQASDFKITCLRSAIRSALVTHRPMLAVCLSHQVLSRELGFELRRLPVPNQGLQREINVFGSRERVGFYNTFAAYSSVASRDIAGIGTVEISRGEETGEVYALRGPGFASVQFHAESVLTIDGPRILGTIIRGILSR